MQVDKSIIQARIRLLGDVLKKQKIKANSGQDNAFGAAISSVGIMAEMGALKTVLNAIRDSPHTGARDDCA
jgi:hypothetical protein